MLGVAVQVTFWGTRGSIAKAGPTTVRYGGNTSCVSVRTEAGTLLVLDCGTGIHELGQVLAERRRPGRRPPPHRAHPLGPHPGPAVLRADVPARQRVARLRAPRARHVDRQGARGSDAVHVLPGPAARLRRDDPVPRPRRGPLRDRRRQRHDAIPAPPGVDARLSDRSRRRDRSCTRPTTSRSSPPSQVRKGWRRRTARRRSTSRSCATPTS